MCSFLLLHRFFNGVFESAQPQQKRDSELGLECADWLQIVMGGGASIICTCPDVSSLFLSVTTPTTTKAAKMHFMRGHNKSCGGDCSWKLMMSDVLTALLLFQHWKITFCLG
jgi:hypothetical protein